MISGQVLGVRKANDTAPISGGHLSPVWGKPPLLFLNLPGSTICFPGRLRPEASLPPLTRGSGRPTTFHPVPPAQPVGSRPITPRGLCTLCPLFLECSAPDSQVIVLVYIQVLLKFHPSAPSLLTSLPQTMLPSRTLTLRTQRRTTHHSLPGTAQCPFQAAPKSCSQ